VILFAIVAAIFLIAAYILIRNSFRP